MTDIEKIVSGPHNSFLSDDQAREVAYSTITGYTLHEIDAFGIEAGYIDQILTACFMTLKRKPTDYIKQKTELYLKELQNLPQYSDECHKFYLGHYMRLLVDD